MNQGHRKESVAQLATLEGLTGTRGAGQSPQHALYSLTSPRVQVSEEKREFKRCSQSTMQTQLVQREPSSPWSMDSGPCSPDAGVRAPRHLAQPQVFPLSIPGTLCVSHMDLLAIWYPCFCGSVPGIASLSIPDYQNFKSHPSLSPGSTAFLASFPLFSWL